MGGEKTRGVFKGVTVLRWAGSTVMAWIALGVRKCTGIAAPPYLVTQT
jgi:hypothetical protein